MIVSIAAEDLRIVLDAARQHYNDRRVWTGVPAPAYFAANLALAEHHRALGDAIERVRIALVSAP